MPVMQLLRGAARHAGSNVKRLVPARRGISSSLQQLSAFEGAHTSSCADTDHPKVLITGRCLVFFVFQAVLPSFFPSSQFPDFPNHPLNV